MGWEERPSAAAVTDASLEGKRVYALHFSSSWLPVMGSSELGLLLELGCGGVQHIGPRGVHTGSKSDGNNLFLDLGGGECIRIHRPIRGFATALDTAAPPATAGWERGD